MPLQHLPVFEAMLKKRGRLWRWSIYTAEGRVVMQGAEKPQSVSQIQSK